jgi:hypothetical protein
VGQQYDCFSHESCPQSGPKFITQFSIKGARGLVKNEQLRIADQRTCDPNTLPLSTG